jgi:hypothetical protein
MQAAVIMMISNGTHQASSHASGRGAPV